MYVKIRNTIAVSERSVNSDQEIFAKNAFLSGLMKEIEYEMYLDITNFMKKSLFCNFQSVIIYVNTPVSECQ